jgi:hypothetical protein
MQQLLYVHAATRSWLPAPLLFSAEQLDVFRTGISPGLCTISHSHREVAASFSRLGFSVELEASVLDGLHAVDVLVHLSSGSLVAVEFDGPTHFLRRIHPDVAEDTARTRLAPNGATLFRNCLLHEAGYDVIVVPFYEWDALVNDAARDAYILTRLDAVRARSDE